MIAARTMYMGAAALVLGALWFLRPDVASSGRGWQDQEARGAIEPEPEGGTSGTEEAVADTDAVASPGPPAVLGAAVEAAGFRRPPDLGGEGPRFDSFPSSVVFDEVDGPRVPPGKELRVDGEGIDRRVIQRIVKAHVNELRYCHQHALMVDTEMTGWMTVRFSVEPNGTVSNPEILRDALGVPETADCVLTAVQRWRYPKHEGSEPLVVELPFELVPEEGRG